MELTKTIMIGTMLNQRYQIQEQLGKGAMGVVYRAKDRVLNREVAVKLLTAKTVDSRTGQRFLREAQEVAKFNHPNIVSIHDFGRHGNHPYIVMELIRGQTLAERMPLSLEDSVHVVYQICMALQHAHMRGVIHRDIKPENVLISTDDGMAKLVDFGIAHVSSSSLTVDGDLVGTVAYMSPEQITGSGVDARTDLYAVGVLLYRLVTHSYPFEAATPFQVLSLHLHQRVRPPADLDPEIPDPLDQLILRLLEKDPDRRPASADEVISALDEILIQSTGHLPFNGTSGNGKFDHNGHLSSLHTLKTHGDEFLDATQLSLIHRYPEDYRFTSRDLKLLFRSSLQAGISLDTWSGRAESPGAALEALSALFDERPGPDTRLQIVKSIAKVDDPESSDLLVEIASSDENYLVRSQAAVACAVLGRKDEIVSRLRSEIERTNNPVAMAAYVAIADESGAPRIPLGLQNLSFLILLGQRRWEKEKDQIKLQSWRGARGAALFMIPAGIAGPFLSAWLSPEAFQFETQSISMPAWVILGVLASVVLGFVQTFTCCFLVGISDMISASRSVRFTLGGIAGLTYSILLVVLTLLGFSPKPVINAGIYVFLYALYGFLMGILLVPLIPHHRAIPQRKRQLIKTGGIALAMAVVTLLLTHQLYAGAYPDEYSQRVLFGMFVAIGLGLTFTRRLDPESV